MKKIQLFLQNGKHLTIPEGPRTHLLAYVKWYKDAPSSDIWLNIDL